jgi:hypothetical protein
MCPACGAKSGSQFNGPLDLPSADDRAIAAWNRRTPSPEVATLIAEARRWGWNAAIEASAEMEDLSAKAHDQMDLRCIGGEVYRHSASDARKRAARIRALKEETP